MSLSGRTYFINLLMFFRNPGRKQGGRLKINLIGIYHRPFEDSYYVFKSLGDKEVVHRRLDLSELHLQCAIVVS